MADNSLLHGQPRIGNLFDGNDKTPQPRAMLQRTETGVLLTIPWDRGETSVYQRWFMLNAQWGDDKDKTRYSYEIPALLVFHDAYGTVHLIGCRWAGMQGGIFGDVGQGNVRADTVVLDGAAQVDPSTIHGLRSEVSGLADWIGAQSIHRERAERGEKGLSSITYTVRSPDPIQVPRRPALTLAPSWKTEPADGTTTLHEQLYVISRFEDPAEWEDHFYLHTAVRDLLSMSCWTPQVFTALQCLHDESPIRTLDGTARGDKWLDVITTRVDVEPLPRKRRRLNYLIEYEDLGPDGLAAWLDLRKGFARAISPIEASVYLSGVTVEVSLMQVGAGLEALAYLLAIREGATPRAAAKQQLQPRLERIADLVEQVAPFNVTDWAKSTAAAYNAVKHANRTLPDPVDLANCWRESVLVFRLWLALELGVEPESLKARVESDPQVAPYISG